VFESISSLNIYFEKSEVLLIQPSNKLLVYDDMFNCQIGNWPIIYLGTPVCARRTIAGEIKFLKEKNEEWNGRMDGQHDIYW
jgi:hypothetical protein